MAETSFRIGQQASLSKTVTEADVTTFAELIGDYKPIHVDAEYARQSRFGQRVAHGLLVLSIASGLVVQTGLMEGTILAFREINEWKFVKPVHIGDTIHVEVEVLETKELRRIGCGAIIIELNVINQDGEKVMKGNWNALIAARPAS